MKPLFRSLPEVGHHLGVEQSRGEPRLEAAEDVWTAQRLQVIPLGSQELPRSRPPDRGSHLLQPAAPVLRNPARVPRPFHLTALGRRPRDRKRKQGAPPNSSLPGGFASGECAHGGEGSALYGSWSGPVAGVRIRSKMAPG